MDERRRSDRRKMQFDSHENWDGGERRIGNDRRKNNLKFTAANEEKSKTKLERKEKDKQRQNLRKERRRNKESNFY